MTPEELRALAARVAAARAAGHSDEAISASFRRNGIPFGSVQELQSTMQAQGIRPGSTGMAGTPESRLAAVPEEAPRAAGRQAELFRRGLGDAGRMAFQGATAGFGDEAIGVGQGLLDAARAVPSGPRGMLDAFSSGRREGTEASRERVEDIRERNPGASLVAELAGGAATGAGAATIGRQVLGRVAPRIAQKLPQAGQSIAQFLTGPGTGAARLTPMGQVGRGLLVGGGLGGAGAGVYGAGEAEGGLLDRVKEGAKAVPFGVAAGMGTAGLLAAPGAARGSMNRTRGAGEIIAEDLQTASGRSRPPSAIREAADEKSSQARTLFQGLEDEGVIPRDIDHLVRTDPVLSQQLKRLEGVPDEIMSGNQPLTFTQADDIAKNLKHEADFYARGGGGTTPGRSDRVRQATEAFDTLDEAMRDALEDYPAAKRLWSESNTELRARSWGRKAVGQTADDIEDGLRRLPQEVGVPSGLSPDEAAAYTDELRKIAQEGMLHEHVARLRTRTGSAFRPAAEAQKMFKAGPETRAQLRQVFPDDASFREFERLLASEASAATLAQRLSVLITAGAFLGGGTSVFAKLFTGG